MLFKYFNIFGFIVRKNNFFFKGVYLCYSVFDIEIYIILADFYE